MIDETYQTNELICSNDKKKKGRKSKKLNEKEIMFQYGTFTQKEQSCFPEEPPVNNDKKNVNDLEQKMTVPINIHQEEYVNALRNQNKKIIVVSGPAGTGKTLFACSSRLANPSPPTPGRNTIQYCIFLYVFWRRR